METSNKTESIDNNKSKLLFDNRALAQKNLNSVLDASNSEKAHRGNILRDFLSKRNVSKTLKPSKTDIILDYGCGVGRLSYYLSKSASQIFGLDISNEMLKVAKKINNSSNISFNTTQEFNQINIKFTKCFTFWVAAHMSDVLLIETLNNIRSKLTKPGKVFIIEQTQSKTKYQGVVHVQRSIKHYENIFQKSGFICTKKKHIIRYPSYAMSLWQKYKWLGRAFLSFLFLIERITCNYKTENVEYYTTAFTLSSNKESN